MHPRLHIRALAFGHFMWSLSSHHGHAFGHDLQSGDLITHPPSLFLSVFLSLNLSVSFSLFIFSSLYLSLSLNLSLSLPNQDQSPRLQSHVFLTQVSHRHHQISVSKTTLFTFLLKNALPLPQWMIYILHSHLRNDFIVFSQVQPDQLYEANSQIYGDKQSMF